MRCAERMLARDKSAQLRFSDVFESAGVSRGSAYRIYDGIDIWAETNGCDPEPELRSDPGHECTVYTGCDEPLELCLHDDGHKLLPGWEERALDWIDEVL